MTRKVTVSSNRLSFTVLNNTRGGGGVQLLQQGCAFLLYCFAQPFFFFEVTGAVEQFKSCTTRVECTQKKKKNSDNTEMTSCVALIIYNK